MDLGCYVPCVVNMSALYMDKTYCAYNPVGLFLKSVLLMITVEPLEEEVKTGVTR